MFKLQSFVRSRRVWMNPARSGRSCPRTEDARIPMLRTCTLVLSGTEPPQSDAVEWKVPEDLDISWRFGSKVKTIKTRRDSEWSSLIRNNRHWLRHCWRHYHHRRPDSVVSEVGISFRHEGFACQGGGKNRKTKHKTIVILSTNLGLSFLVPHLLFCDVRRHQGCGWIFFMDSVLHLWRYRKSSVGIADSWSSRNSLWFLCCKWN